MASYIVLRSKAPVVADEREVVASELPPPTSADEIPVIECRRGLEDAGHAFAIVGYTSKGFVVRNSWGPTWGRGGFGILTYSDWRPNAMDAWVVQLGVVTKEHEEVAKASSLRVTDRRSAQVVISGDATLSAHEVSPFVIDMQNQGQHDDEEASSAWHDCADNQSSSS